MHQFDRNQILWRLLSQSEKAPPRIDRPSPRRKSSRDRTWEMKKAPGRTSGLFLFDAFCRSEPVIETRAHDVGAEARVGPGDRAAVAEIDIDVFGLGGPRSSNRRFEAAADGPAHFGVARVADAGDRRLDVAEGCAAGHVGHEAIEGIAETAAHGAEIIVARLAAGSQAGRAAAEIGPIEITLDAEHRLAHLPVVTERAADQAAGGIERAGRERCGEIRFAPAAAAVDTDVEAGPVVGRRHID